MIKNIIISCFLLAATSFANAELVVVAHHGTPFQTIPLSQLSRIFLGQTSIFSDGSRAIPLDISGDLRNQFYSNILKRKPEQVEKYWARMIFTGKAQPPREIRAADVKNIVAETPGAISYMDSSKVDGSVKILRVDTER